METDLTYNNINTKSLEKPKVSIIVPVYNAGEYLRKCLDSIIHQTLRELEILLILDCPTDGSDKLAEEYAQSDSRVKLIYNKVNLHTGFSRNEGIKYAMGEYIGFADHDDYCEPEMFEELYNLAKQELADVVISNFYDENKDGRSFFAFPEGYNSDDFQKAAFKALIRADYSIRNSHSFSNMNVIWNQIYRREFLSNNNILFHDNRVFTMEDMFFSLKVYHFAQRVCYLPKTYYHHVNTDVNNYNNYGYQSIHKVIPLLEEMLKFIKTNGIWSKYIEEFSICTLKRLYSSFRNEIKFKGLFSIPQFIRVTQNNQSVQEILANIHQNKSILKKFALTKQLFYYSIQKKKLILKYE